MVWFINHIVGAHLLKAYTALGVRDGCCCCVLRSIPIYVLLLLKVVTHVQVFDAWLYYLLMFKLLTETLRLC